MIVLFNYPFDSSLPRCCVVNTHPEDFGGMGSASWRRCCRSGSWCRFCSSVDQTNRLGHTWIFLLAVLLYVTHQGQVGEVETLQRTGVEMKSDPASPVDSTLPEVPAPPAPESTPVPTPEPKTVPVIPGEKSS